MKGCFEPQPGDKFRNIKKVVVLGQEISEDVLKKMNFAETRKFCLGIESDLRKFIANPLMYFLFSWERIGMNKTNFLGQRTKHQSWIAKNGSCCTIFPGSLAFATRFVFLGQFFCGPAISKNGIRNTTHNRNQNQMIKEWSQYAL